MGLTGLGCADWLSVLTCLKYGAFANRAGVYADGSDGGSPVASARAISTDGEVRYSISFHAALGWSSSR